MFSVRRVFISTLIVGLSVLTGCAVNPVTGEKEFSLVSPQQEVAMGAQNYGPSQQSQGGLYYIDPQIQRYVADVGYKLAAVSDRPDLPYEFVVLNNPVPNAWALPGGKIAVNSGLLWNLEDEAQLAAVLAHEIVHAAARHGASQMSRGMVIGAGAQIAGAVAGSAGYGDLGGAAAQLGAQAWMARYGRDDELESDAYGMEYMSRAGYDPQAAVELQQTFVKLNEGRQQDFISGLFASHPPSPTRVSKNREHAARLAKGGVRNKSVYQKRIAQLLKDKPAYEAQGDAIKALNDKNPKQALSHLDKAINIQPREGYFWELRGHAWQRLEDNANAEKAFTTAINNNAEYFSHYLARGVLRYDMGKKSAAKTDLERSAELLPTPVASFYLGELASARGDKAEAIGYYQQAAQSSSTLGRAAQKKLVVMELAQAPDKYVLSQVTVGNDGYLWIAVKNRAPVSVANVSLELVELVNSANAYTARGSARVTGPKILNAGQTQMIPTRIGPIRDKSDLARYRVRVTSASPLN